MRITRLCANKIFTKLIRSGSAYFYLYYIVEIISSREKYNVILRRLDFDRYKVKG